MRPHGFSRLAVCLALVAFAGCEKAAGTRPPPSGRFYFPSGVLHADVPGTDAGVLYVSNGNFDKRFDNGSLVALALDPLGLPAFGSAVGSEGPVQLTELGLTEAGTVNIASFAGELAAWARPSGGLRLFTPSRSEGDYLQIVDAPVPAAGQAPVLSCATVDKAGSRDCTSAAPSLTAYQDTTTGLPRATAPYGVTVAPDGAVFVTHLSNADSPKGSNKNLTAYIVALNAEQPIVDGNSFIPLGPGAVNTAVAGARWLYLSGRAISGGTQLVRLMARDQSLLSGSLEYELGIVEARGLAVSSDETRLYLAGRGPDLLVVASITGATTDSPAVRVMRTVPLPAGANQVLTIARPGRSDLVAITCSTAGVVAIYDDDLGALSAQVPGVGLQPFSISADRRGAGVRLYVTNFGDGRVAVVDVPDLNQPHVARVVAHLGAQQLCLTRSEREGKCTE